MLLSDAVTKSYQSLMDEYPITMDQLYEVSKESTGVYYTHIMQVLSMMGYTGTVHIWIRRKTEKGYDLLLQKRSKQKDSFPGCYDISSAGHISAGDEPLETALRELEEELGIKAEPEQLKKVCMHEGSMNGNFYGREFKNHEISTVYMYEETVDITKLKLQKEEVEEVMWMDQEELIQKVRDGGIPNCIYLDEVEKF